MSERGLLRDKYKSVEQPELEQIACQKSVFDARVGKLVKPRIVNMILNEKEPK